MKDFIPKGTGNSRYLKSAITAGTTWEQFKAMLIAGTAPIDLNGLNAAGIQQMGTALNTANLLKGSTASLLGLTADVVPDDALCVLGCMFYKKTYVTETVDKTFVVPPGVTEIAVWGCASGSITGAGEFLCGHKYSVTPGTTLTITVGNGNTIISGPGVNITLLAGAVTRNYNFKFLGFETGVDGGQNARGFGGGYGGAYGFGGGGGGYGGTSAYGGVGGGSDVFSGGATGGGNGIKIPLRPTSPLFEDLVFYTAGGGGHGPGDTAVSTAGGGSDTRRGGNPIADAGGGGAAGGFGAQGGYGSYGYNGRVSGTDGAPSPGFVVIACKYTGV